jgi:hypothetical protein
MVAYAIIRGVRTADWFERLTGFPERDYQSTQIQLVVEGDELVSTTNRERYGIGNLTLTTSADSAVGPSETPTPGSTTRSPVRCRLSSTPPSMCG